MYNTLLQHPSLVCLFLAAAMSRASDAALSPHQALQASAPAKTPTPKTQKRKQQRDQSARPANRSSPDRFIAGASRQRFFCDSQSDYASSSPRRSSAAGTPTQRFDQTIANALGLGNSPGRVHSYAQRSSPSGVLQEHAGDRVQKTSPTRSADSSPTRCATLNLAPYKTLDAVQKCH